MYVKSLLSFDENPAAKMLKNVAGQTGFKVLVIQTNDN